MAKWAGSNVLDSGLNYIKTNANKMILLKAYSAADSYATVNGTNNICEVAMASGDYTLASSGSNRTLTTGTKSAAASSNSGASPNLHVAWVNTTGSEVCWVSDETSDQVVTSGNTVNFPAFVYTANQPT